MDESAFISAADATLDRIGLALDAALETSGADLDWDLTDGVLTIECDDASRVIVNRHVPNREIWVAAKSGGFHFRAVDGQWRDTRSGAELGAALAALLDAQAGLSVRLAALRAPAVCRCGRRQPAAMRRGGARRRGAQAASSAVQSS